MKKMYLFLSMVTVFALALSACAPATPVATEPPAPTAVPPTAVPPTATEAPPAIGSPEHPIKVLFVPSVDANVIVTG
ncbi:MAG TPA: hypothetical protein PLR65_13535, partial [Anaerolineales bacterium]|nr:hypothetical protein [Anaerolineales bacterium]